MIIIKIAILVLAFLLSRNAIPQNKTGHDVIINVPFLGNGLLEIKEHEAVFKGVGFSQIKYWYQPQNFPYRSGKEFLENAVNKHSFTNDPEVRAEMERIYDEQSGLNTSDMRTWEVMVILAFKD